ncbi:MAG: pyridoxal phosphate-dependent aminotransferase, partial [Deltaproteobacteria bacterium]
MRSSTDLGLGSASLDDRALSRLSQGLVGSEVLRIAAEVRSAIAAGREVCNLTVGDFDPREFPLPRKLVEGIRAALDAGHSNYPPSNGVLELRQSVLELYRREMGLDYPLESVVVA